jgi:hypothetical protein
VSHKTLVAEANAICRDWTKQGEALGTKGHKPSLAVISAKGAAIIDGVRVRFARLQPSSSDRALYDRFLAELGRRAALEHALQVASQKGNKADVNKVIVNTTRELSQLSRVIRQLGFKKCLVKD